MMTPEQEARQEIDHLLESAGWSVVDHGDYNSFAGRGMARREVGLWTGFADYLQLVNRKALGVVEAKRVRETKSMGHSLKGGPL
ncbi:MAG: hypothetical protein L0332_22790 [Chloroflexi bacterium]|nr:hypothetical protein [Chloroflexota bacterium]MCI0580400.1 hypothetical protein [Chloroflexota bacterium]MCI0650171.1 hypothetical protein [Chloroflexota bacterium]MCI0729518.1 hypothetical protein [Chloroflexota bacterium]